MTETFDDYIGDGVYVSFDGYQIWLKAERDGFTHKIALEPSVFDALLAYERRLRQRLNVSRDTNVGEEDRA